MGQQPVQHDQAAAPRLERHRRGLRPRHIVERVGDQAIAGAMETLAQRPAMAARQRHQAAIVAIGIVESDPQAGDRDGPGVEVRRILVPSDFGADLRLLEEVHRLQQQRLHQAQCPCQRGQSRLARNAVEDRIEIVQRMADLVQRQRHRLVGRSLFEEEADGATRLLEIAIAGVALVARRKDRAHWARVEARHQLRRPVLQGVAIGRRQKAFQHEEAVARIIGQMRGCEAHRAHWTILSMTTERSTGALSPMRIARRTMSIAASASPSLAAWTMHNGLLARTWAPTSMTSLRPTDASIASSAWLRPPPSATPAIPTPPPFIPPTCPDPLPAPA